MDIIEAMQDRALFAKTFQPKKALLSRKLQADTWQNWKIFLSALFGLGLATAEARETYRKFTGREDVPANQFREAYLIAGRRSGKSIIAALVAVFMATCRSYKEFLVGGEQGIVMVLAADRRQARIIFNYIVSFLESPLLKGLVLAKRKESIDLSNSVRIEVHTSNYRSVRGATLICAILDELSFWQDENSANPDVEVVRALLPSMATIPSALLLGVSSPYAKRGKLYEMHKEHFGKPSDVLIWQGDSLSMNPSLASKVVSDAYLKDPASASAEYGAQFRSDVQNFISVETVEAAVIRDRRELPYDVGKSYYGFADPSGGVADSFCMAVGHFEHEKAVLDYVREVQAPLSPKVVAAEFSAIFKAYHIFEIEGDAYGGMWVKDEFSKHGVTYKASEKSKNEIYLAALAGLMSGQCELLDNPRLIAQLTGLERKTGRLHDVIDHSINSHDDLANATSGVLVQVLSANVTGVLGLIALHKEYESGAREMPKSPAEITATVRHKEPAVLKPKCPICGGDGRPAPVLGGFWCVQDGVSLDRDGKATSQPTNKLIVGVNCCDAPLPQIGGQKCGNCGREVSRPATEIDFQQRAAGVNRWKRLGQNALSVHSDDPVSRWFRNFPGPR